MEQVCEGQSKIGGVRECDSREGERKKRTDRKSVV